MIQLAVLRGNFDFFVFMYTRTGEMYYFSLPSIFKGNSISTNIICWKLEKNYEQR